MTGEALWELAGPRLFVAAVEDALRQRVNVVAHTSDPRMPRLLSEGLKGTLAPKQLFLREAAPDSWSGDWTELMKLWVPEGETLEDHCRDLGQQSLLLLIPKDARVTALLSMLLRWQHATRQLPPESRPALVAVAYCAVADKIQITGDVALTPIDWDGFLSLSDIEAFAWPRLNRPGRPLPRAVRRMLARTVAEVSQGDPDLAEYLCSCRYEEIASPELALARWLERQAGKRLPEQILVEGEWRPHSARDLQGSGGRCKLRERLWRAQAAELLPWVESQRARLVDGLKERLTLKDSLGRDVASVHELDIGEIWYQLDRSGKRDTAWQLFGRLREMRNFAAHGTVLSLPRILDTFNLINSNHP